MVVVSWFIVHHYPEKIYKKLLKNLHLSSFQAMKVFKKFKKFFFLTDSSSSGKSSSSDSDSDSSGDEHKQRKNKVSSSGG